jgi:hypothetical protein
VLLFSATLVSHSRADKIQDIDNEQVVNYLFSLNNIEVVDADNVEKQYPTWARMDHDMKNTSLSYWVNNVLPFKQDRNKNAYIVYPKA